MRELKKTLVIIRLLAAMLPLGTLSLVFSLAPVQLVFTNSLPSLTISAALAKDGEDDDHKDEDEDEDDDRDDDRSGSNSGSSHDDDDDDDDHSGSSGSNSGSNSGSGSGSNSGSGSSGGQNDDDGDDAHERDDRDHADWTLADFISQLNNGSAVASAQQTNGDIIIIYTDGWREMIVGGMYQLVDPHGRKIVNRRSNASDVRRLSSAL